jgi:SAM-dependent methyltransferase
VIEASGEPVLDLGCGTGRLLVPLLRDGVDVDGTDISADMLGYARTAADQLGRSALLVAQANHDLDLPRRYRTVIACGSVGIGGRRDHDLETMRRVHRHLLPGGTFVMDQQLAYDRSPEGWRHWLPGERVVPRAWPEGAERVRLRDGDELELVTRLVALDRLEARQTLEIRARRFRDGILLDKELGTLDENLYLVPELRLMLETAGFDDIRVEGPYTGAPAGADDRTVVLVARRGT